jgi:hypothetical protein
MKGTFMAAVPPIGHSEPALNLAMALVASSTAPLLFLDENLTVIAVSMSFCRTFDELAVNVVGHKLFEVGAREWDIPQLKSLLWATLAGSAEVDATRWIFKAKAIPIGVCQSMPKGWNTAIRKVPAFF